MNQSLQVLKIIICFLCFFALGFTSEKMTGEEIEKYIQKKLKRNDKLLRINGKNLGDEGVSHLAKLPLLQTVSTLSLIHI